MPDALSLREGQILTGSLFNEPMRVETVQPNGPSSCVAGLAKPIPSRRRDEGLVRAGLPEVVWLALARQIRQDVHDERSAESTL